jgi:hypothetical protein
MARVTATMGKPMPCVIAAGAAASKVTTHLQLLTEELFFDNFS